MTRAVETPEMPPATTVRTGRPAKQQSDTFRSLVEGLDAVFWELDTATWTFTYVSPQAVEKFGYPIARWAEPGFWADVIIHPDDRGWAVDFCVTATGRHEDHDFVYRAVTAAGEVVWLRDLVRVIARADGPPLLRGVMIDVTQAERAKAEAEELRRQLHEAQALAGVGSWRWTVADDQVSWSPELYRVFGLDPSAHTPSRDDYLQRVVLEDREEAAAEIGRALEEGGRFDAVRRIVRADTGAVRHIRTRGRALRDALGEVCGLFGTCQDITDAREAQRREQALFEASVAREQAQQAQRSLQRLLEQAPAAIAVYEGRDLIISVASARWLEIAGRAAEACIGRSIREIFADDPGVMALADTLERVFDTGEPFEAKEFQVDYTAGDGTPRSGCFDFVLAPIRDDHAVSAVMGISFDVTQRVEARRAMERHIGRQRALTARLAASNKELEQFAYITSHDLRAPLRGIANLASWVTDDLGDALPDESRRHLDLLMRRVGRMEALINGILAYSRAGRTQTDVESVSLAALVAETVDLLDLPDGVVQLREPLSTILTERVPLQQVLQNLIGNAVKHARGQADLRVVVSETPREDGFVELSVSDNGPGIDPRYHDRIWTIFQTLRPRDEFESAGVGLSLVRKIVEQRGGTVRLSSAEGDGATFTFTWPRDARAETGHA